MSSNIFNCCLYQAAADTYDFTWTDCASCLFNTAWFIHVAADWADIFDTPTKQEKTSQTLLHTVSSKHVVQPGNRSKTLSAVWAWTCPSLHNKFLLIALLAS